MTRAQALERPEHSAHFQLFATVLAGRDPGGRTSGLEQQLADDLAGT